MQDWALGVLHAKIIAAITLMGPQWWLKAVIEQVDVYWALGVNISVVLDKLWIQKSRSWSVFLTESSGFNLIWIKLDQNVFKLSPQVYANGIRNIDLQFIIRRLAAPVISVLLLSLCVPYVIAAGVVPAVGQCLNTHSRPGLAERVTTRNLTVLS